MKSIASLKLKSSVVTGTATTSPELGDVLETINGTSSKPNEPLKALIARPSKLRVSALAAIAMVWVPPTVTGDKE